MEHLSEKNNTTEKALDLLASNDDDTIEAFGAMQLLSSTVLAAAARGDIDLNAIASWMLASRGQDAACAWVGFPEAERLHHERLGK
jgi:hypothetical protein